MFQDLLLLYKKNTNKTPLEDFNTECFAGILNMYPDIKDDFLYNFLELPVDDYDIITQLRKDLDNESNCIIDFVLMGKENVCFIENKVESTEGFDQLNRYTRVLDKYYSDQTKFLFYCTKYSDTKNSDETLNDYGFRQFRWYEVAKFLRPYMVGNPTLDNYITFLTTHKMAQDNTFKAEHLLTMVNLLKTVEIAEFHINNSHNQFHEAFSNIGRIDKKNKNFKLDHLKQSNRFSNKRIDVLKSDRGGSSEINYMISFEELVLGTYVGIENYHEQYDLFLGINIINTAFEFVHYETWGSIIVKRSPLGTYLNDNNSDARVKDWFLESFAELKEIIGNNSQLDWNNVD